MAKQQMDDEANLKRQARRRLIGAVALVTAVVVILPMVLDSEPQLDGQNIELRIPDQNDAGEFKPKITLPPAPPTAAPESGVSTTTVKQPPAAEAAALVKPAAEEAKPAPAKSEPTKPEPAKPAPQPAAKPVAKPAPQPATVPKQGYAVQIGAYSNAAAADKLKAKLLLQGLPAYTEKSGSNVRVRVGPYATRAEAEKELKKLKAQGMHPVLSTLK